MSRVLVLVQSRVLIFPPSAISLQPSLYSQQQAEIFLNTSNYFHAFKIATFAFKPYTYVLTAPRSKSRKPASKPVSIFDKLQRMKLSSAELNTPQSAAANNYGSDKLGIRDLIVLLGDSDSSAFKAEVDDSSLCAESAAAIEDLLNSPETTIAPAPPNSDMWHDIDDLLETAEHLQRSKPQPSTSNSIRPHTSSSSRASSGPLHDYTSVAGHQSSLCNRALPENQPIYENHLCISKSLANEHELEVLSSILYIDRVNEEKKQQQELKQKKDEAHGEDDGLQQDVNDVAATKKVDNTHLSDKGGSPRPAKRQKLLLSHDPLPKLSHNKAKDRSDSDSDDELNDNKAGLKEDSKEPCPMKRKQSSSFHNGPIQKGRKYYLQQRSSQQHRPYSKPHRRSPTLRTPFNQASRVTAVSSAEGRLPSLQNLSDGLSTTPALISALFFGNARHF
ncbi:uncharacterized protein LY89DRAFT_744085 [Mollisia scopiformis]|uniref:Uncharacterized protein n=1 Tax=Mollisia scopiformis TaxID=149040 RepID=A0A132B196_MOLSC|nr:uncharacterized protein LY89DRAFT_744085 [Mollisia scopiformis]KUJ06150.1 hypothetical protein LY89DRAFT_744085 [Mollisia scopiformis]